MSLLIACILIYHFGLPWWLYLVAVVAFAGKLWAFHIFETTQNQNMDGRFNMLNRLLEAQGEQLSAALNTIEGHAKDVRDSCDAIETQLRKGHPPG